MSLRLPKDKVALLQKKMDEVSNLRIDINNIIAEGIFYLGDKPAPKQVETTEEQTEPKAKILLVEGKWHKELPGTLIDDPVQNDVTTRSGPATVANVRMEGDYGTVKVALWNKQADAIMKYTAGDSVILTNVQVKPEYNDEQQIGGSRNTRIKEPRQ